MRARLQHIARARVASAVLTAWLTGWSAACKCGDDPCGDWMELGHDYEIEVLAFEDDRVQHTSCGEGFDLTIGTTFALRNIEQGELVGDGHNCAADCFSTRAELDLQGVELLGEGTSGGPTDLMNDRARVGACTGEYSITISNMDAYPYSFREGAPSNFLLTRQFSADTGSCAMHCADDFWVRVTDANGSQISEDVEP